MQKNEVVELYKWYDELRRTRRDSEIISEIENRIPSALGNHELQTLNGLLATELRRQGKYERAEQILLNLAKLNPEEPGPLISLAELKLFYEEKPEKALEIIDQAIDLAYQSGRFRRQALGVKARIAERMGRYAILERILRELMEISAETGGADVGIERDFFDRLPADAIDPELAKKYDRFSRGRGS